MEPLELVNTDLDAMEEEALESYLNLIQDLGSFYLDAEAPDVFVYNPPGTPHVEQITDHVSEVLLSEGHLNFMFQGRRDLAPMGAAYCGAYHKRLTSFLRRKLHRLNLPKIHGYYNLPAMIEEGGRLYLANPGYHKPSKVLFLGKPTHRSDIDKVDPGYPHLHRWLSDIHFTADEYRGNLMAFIVASFARNLMNEFPIMILDSTSKQQGKTTTAAAFLNLLTGNGASPFTHTGAEEEVEKRIAGDADRPGPAVCFMDNIRPKRGQSGTIRGQLFATATTSPRPKVRPVYGKKLVPLNYPIFMLTMNDAVVEPDLVDRSIRVVLTGISGRYFKPNPQDYVRRHRIELIHEIQHILLQTDLTQTCTFESRFGLFEKVARHAASKLGLPINLMPHGIDTPDSFVKELVASWRELEEEHDRPPTWEALSGHVRVTNNLTELNNFFARKHASSDKARGKLLKAEVERVSRQRLYVDNKEIKLHVRDTHMQVEVL